jgi:hypothetical protein
VLPTVTVPAVPLATPPFTLARFVTTEALGAREETKLVTTAPAASQSVAVAETTL